MRILKRNLAFMLAMIMALSLTAFAGYEDYSDVEELTYVEAVDVLTELGIVEGSDGALLPTGNLTRAQAAKLIAYTMLGKKAADALQAEVAP
ncbi:MAG: S-layer homology domain-containing protein, partial [Clostridia bacterium]|nr:S-layer homology domain-containing protein [Clostridia bacterium]